MNRVKFVSPDEAVRLIESGDHVYVQGSTSIPEVLVEALDGKFGGSEKYDSEVFLIH